MTVLHARRLLHRSPLIFFPQSIVQMTRIAADSPRTGMLAFSFDLPASQLWVKD
jgi:hypothetical protein